MGSITGATDNQGNTYAVTKLMSTKYPLPILLMELSESLRLGSIFLDLRWVPRERNQWADDLTNGEFGRFPADKRQELDAHTMQWHVLGRLLDVAQTFHDEMVAEKEAAKQRQGGGQFQRALCGRPKGPGLSGELRRLALRGVIIHVWMRAATFAFGIVA